MSKYKFTLDRNGISQFLKSEEVAKIIKEKTKAVYDAVGDTENYAMQISTRGSRTRGYVKPSTPRGYNSNLKHNTLQKAIGSARG